MATDREPEGTPHQRPAGSSPSHDDDLDEVRRRAAERAGEIERLSAKISDLHGEIEAYRKRRGNA